MLHHQMTPGWVIVTREGNCQFLLSAFPNAFAALTEPMKSMSALIPLDSSVGGGTW